ncbi:MAG: hypothetical protein ACTTKD_07375 [Peptoanaerobacter stomatis]|uniref:hypothetical protein n=1 Tax=Peptoanaerobacter stomatis TaxID=796937 RepID=UPI003F9EDC3C
MKKTKRIKLNRKEFDVTFEKVRKIDFLEKRDSIFTKEQVMDAFNEAFTNMYGKQLYPYK